MARVNLSELNVWSAALLALECRAHAASGVSRPVRWQCSRDSARYQSKREVVVQPLGVRLLPGEVLEVRWAPNETAYDVQVCRGSKP